MKSLPILLLIAVRAIFFHFKFWPFGLEGGIQGAFFLSKIQELIIRLYRETKMAEILPNGYPCYSLISELHSSVFRICTHSEFGIALAEVKKLLKLRFL